MSLSRRQVLVAGAVLPLVYVTPTIVSVPVAWANPPHSVPPRSTKPPESVSPPMGPPLATDLPAVLPFTGNNEGAALEVGVAALTTGAVLVALNRPEKRAMQ